jgi:hypothetical protein
LNKTEITQLNDSKLFASFHDYVVKLVKEANSVRGETKKTSKEFDLIVNECIERFNLDRETLIEEHIIDNF